MDKRKDKKFCKKLFVSLGVLIALFVIIYIVLIATGTIKTPGTKYIKYKVNEVNYNLYEKEKIATVESSPEARGKITIPSFIIYKEEKYYVTTISRLAFTACERVSELVISEGITVIESESITNTHIYNVVLPNSLEICKNDFSDYIRNNGENVTEERGFYYIGTEENPYILLANVHNIGAENISIPEGVKCIYNYCDFGNVKQIFLPDSLNRFDLKISSLEEIVINETSNLNSIDNLDACTKLLSLYIPKYCNYVCDLKENFNLSKIEVHKDNTKYDSRDNCNALIETKSNTLLFGTSNTIIIDGITKISDYAFYKRKIEQIEIPESVTSIGESAFEGSYVKNIYIPSKIKTIGDYAFANCSYLESFVIDKGFDGTIGLGVLYKTDDTLRLLVLPFIGYKRTGGVNITEYIDNSKVGNIKINKITENSDYFIIEQYEHTRYYYFKYGIGWLFANSLKHQKLSVVTSTNLIGNEKLEIYINSSNAVTLYEASIASIEVKNIYILNGVDEIATNALYAKIYGEKIFISENVNTIKSTMVDFTDKRYNFDIYCETLRIKPNWDSSWDKDGVDNVMWGYDFTMIYEIVESYYN